MLVEGRLGSGVSRLLDDLSTALRKDRVQVRRARLSAAEHVGALAALRADLAPGPAVVVVDDGHRIPADSVTEVADLLRDPVPGVAVVLGGRAGQMAQAVRACARGQAHQMPAWELTEVRTAYPSLGRNRAERLLEAAEGRPAFVMALAGMRLLELLELHRLPIDALSERLDLTGFRGWAAETFADEGTRLVAAAAAVLGDTVDVDAVAEIAELPRAGLAHAALVTLVDEGVLGVREGRISFVHPVLKAVCYAQVDLATRRTLHLRALERARDPRWPGLVPLASHLCVAATAGDPTVVAELVDAARECLGTSPSAAERWSRCALRLCPSPDSGLAVSARLVIGSALAAQGRVVEAAAVAKELLSIPAARRPATVLAARCERALGHDAVASALMRAEVRDTAPGELSDDVLLEAAIAGILPAGVGAASPRLGHEVAIDIVTVVRDEAADTDRDELVARLDGVHARVAALASTELSRIVEQLAPLALTCLRLGRTELAAGLVDHGLHVVGPRGEVLVDLLNAQAAVELRRGRLALSRGSAERAAETAAELGLVRAASLSRALLGQLDAAISGCAAADLGPALATGLISPQGEVESLYAEAHALLATAPAEPWWVGVLGRGARAGRSGGPRQAALAAEAAVCGGDLESARHVLGERPQQAPLIDLAWWTRAAAVVLTQSGELQAGQEAALEAVAAWSAIGWPLEISRSRLVLAETLRRLGDHSRAEREAGLAKAAALRHGALAVAQRAVVLQKRIAASQSRGLRGGEFGLSAREAEIARLVCSGRTNREIAGQLFLSVRTVDSHVAKVLTKVGVQTRVALTAMFASLEPAVA